LFKSKLLPLLLTHAVECYTRYNVELVAAIEE